MFAAMVRAAMEAYSFRLEVMTVCPLIFLVKLVKQIKMHNIATCIPLLFLSLTPKKQHEGFLISQSALPDIRVGEGD